MVVYRKEEGVPASAAAAGTYWYPYYHRTVINNGTSRYHT
jgi:hypothetical protein